MELAKTTNADVELLRKALLRVSLIVGGHDDGLDDILSALRDALKNGELNKLNGIVAQLGDRLLELEQTGSGAPQQVRQVLRELASDWLAFSLEKSLEKTISTFVSTLPSAFTDPAQFLHFAGELRNIQLAAMAQLQKVDGSFLGRIFSRRQLVQAVEPVEALTTNEAVAVSESVNWHRLLNPLLDALKTYHPDTEHLEAFRAQLAQEPAQDALHVINELYGFIRQILSDSSNAFKQYLDTVSQELAELTALINANLGVEAAQTERRNAWHERFQEQIHNFATHTDTIEDLAHLKLSVQQQITDLRAALADLREVDKEQNQMRQVLSHLVSKVKKLEQEAEQNQQHLVQQQHRATHDALTGLPNRYAYEERVKNELQRFFRYERSAVLAVFDIDHFKKINDEHGHIAGDRVLQVIGNSLAKRLRKVDFFGRYGGEEFVAILPETEIDQAHLLLDKIREAVNSAAFNYKEKPLAISISIGMTAFQKNDTAETLFERADAALYEAKQAGRNCIKIN